MSRKNKYFIFVFFSAILGFGCQKSGFQVTPASETSFSSLSPAVPIPLAPQPQAQPQPTTVPVAPTTLAKLGTLDPLCMTKPIYDTCIFWKNPVAQRGKPFNFELNIGDDLSADQIYGVTLKNLLSANQLRSASINIIATDGVLAKPVAGVWKFPYKDDTLPSYVAQLMAYFWLTSQQTEMERLSGVFYAKGKSIIIDAINGSVANNAFWDGTQIVLGVADMAGSQHEMALSAEVYLHEMGHANFQFATAADLFVDNNGNNFSCKTDQGCISAINEGQADFHSIIMFDDRTSIGETWLNSIDGLAERDVKKMANLSVTEFFKFSSPNGEIHTLGTAYTSILYKIYTNPNVVKQDFLKLFSLSLQKMTSRTRFPDARDIFIADDVAFFAGKYSTIIRQAFTDRGVQ